MRMLVDTQLSNYDVNGRFILEADSGYQMCVGRIREMLKLDPNLYIDITGPALDISDSPKRGQVVTSPYEINPDLPWGSRLNWVGIQVEPNALITRYDFNWKSLEKALDFKRYNYHSVYVNDPMRLRALRAMFLLNKQQNQLMPKFFTHSHFVDVPSAPKFPVEASLWHGQCEAAIRSDYNFWQCESALLEWEREARHLYRDNVVNEVMEKSVAWDDGYSSTEMNLPIHKDNIRFDINEFFNITKNKIVIFVPNRIGGKGRSSDYTNCGMFMFDVLPRLRKIRQDFVVIAGNPSQKFSNTELEVECGPNGYISLVPDSLRRDEYRWIAKNCDISIGLYNVDTYGGTASREIVDVGKAGHLPLWANCNEYRSIAQKAGYGEFTCNVDANSIVKKLIELIDLSKENNSVACYFNNKLRKVVKERCSYENTTKKAYQIMINDYV